MNVEVIARLDCARASSRALPSIDCDIHPGVDVACSELYPVPRAALAGASGDLRRAAAARLSERAGLSQGSAGRLPRATPGRPAGGKPGSDLDFMRAQHLDPNNVAFGILNPLAATGQGMPEPRASAPRCAAPPTMAGRRAGRRREPRLQRLDRGAVRGRRGGGGRDRALGRRQRRISRRCCC